MLMAPEEFARRAGHDKRADIAIESFYEWCNGTNDAIYHCSFSCRTGDIDGGSYEDLYMRSSNSPSTIKKIGLIDEKTVDKAIRYAESLKGLGFEVTINGKTLEDAKKKYSGIIRYRGIKNVETDKTIDEFIDERLRTYYNTLKVGLKY